MLFDTKVICRLSCLRAIVSTVLLVSMARKQMFIDQTEVSQGIRLSDLDALDTVCTEGAATFARASANLSAMALPMPEAPPVTTAVRFRRRVSVGMGNLPIGGTAGAMLSDAGVARNAARHRIGE